MGLKELTIGLECPSNSQVTKSIYQGDEAQSGPPGLRVDEEGEERHQRVGGVEEVVLEGGHAVPVHRNEQDPVVIFSGCLVCEIKFGRWIKMLENVIRF